MLLSPAWPILPQLQSDVMLVVGPPARRALALENNNPHGIAAGHAVRRFDAAILGGVPVSTGSCRLFAEYKCTRLEATSFWTRSSPRRIAVWASHFDAEGSRTAAGFS